MSACLSAADAVDLKLYSGFSGERALIKSSVFVLISGRTPLNSLP